MTGPVRLVRSTQLSDVAEYAYAATVDPPARLVHLAGACPLDRAGRTVAPGDPAGQAAQAMDNLETALAAAGGALTDVVRTTVYVASSEQADLVAAWEMVRDRFGTHDVPSTLLGVAALGCTDQLVEIEAVAALTSQGPGTTAEAAGPGSPGGSAGPGAETGPGGATPVSGRPESGSTSPVRPSGPGRVLGVDRCQGAWVGVLLDGGAVTGWRGGTIEELVSRVGGPLPDVVGIDIPIGIADDGLRPADLLAREVVGPRRSSVFTTPVREALEAIDYPAANAANRRRTGQGLSRQAFALGAAIREVDRWVRGAGTTVIEVHPEVCFATLAGAPLPWPKRTWAGARERLRLLESAGVELPADLGEAAGLPVDDVLDAAVVAWSARRYLTGTAVSYPDPPARFGDGLVSAIWA